MSYRAVVLRTTERNLLIMESSTGQQCRRCASLIFGKCRASVRMDQPESLKKFLVITKAYRNLVK